MIILEPKSEFDIPVEAENISPDVFSDKSLADIRGLPVYHGNQEVELADLFEIEKEDGEKADASDVIIRGDVSSVKRIGEGMTSGKITIEGDAGMHLGCAMKGGGIIVEGNVDDYAGERMEGGTLKINGDAGNRLGSGSPGEEVGMKGGLIVLQGDAGHEVGRRMRRGVIAVRGDLGDFAGTLMDGGSIISFGEFGERPAAGMDRGSLIAFNDPQILPTFKQDCIYNPVFIRILLSELKNHDLPIEEDYLTGLYERYSGDLSALGKGEILVWSRASD